MKRLLPLILFSFVFQSVSAQFTAYRPDDAFYNWWTQSWVLDEVGEGTVDSLFVDIEIDGQIAVVNYRYYLRALPNAANANEDNDSLELKTFFTAPENVVFTEMRMLMNDSIRVGRVIEKSKAVTIYENLVYNPSPDPSVPNWDPGLLIKDGNDYEFRAYPVGEEDLAYMELTAIVELSSDNAISKSTDISLDLFAQSKAPIKKVTISYHANSDYASVVPTGMQLDWDMDSTGKFMATATDFTISHNLGLDLLNTQPHDVNYSHVSIPGYETHLWTVPLNGVQEELETHFVVLLDIDWNHFASSVDQSAMATKIENAISLVGSLMTTNDKVKMLVTSDFIFDYSAEWMNYSIVDFENMKTWAMGMLGEEANIVSATEYIQNQIGGLNSHVIIFTNDYFDADQYTPADLQSMAQTTVQHGASGHADIYSLNQSSQSESIKIGKQQVDVLQTFFEEYTGNLNGHYDYLQNSQSAMKSQIDKSGVRLEYVTAESNPLATNFHYMQGVDEDIISVFSHDDYSVNPESFTLEYSSGQQLSVDIGSLFSSEVDTGLWKLAGRARIYTAQTTSAMHNMSYRDYENLSVDYRIVTDYSALLVVEHDSMYNDTIPDLFTPWVLDASDPTHADLESQISVNVYPNPASDLINIRALSAEIEKVELRDIMGRTVMNKDGLKGLQANVSGLITLPRGVYVVAVYLSDGEVIQHRIILE